MINVEVGRKGIEDLAGVCKVCFEGVDSWVRERSQVKVEDGVTLGQKVRNHMAACFS